MRKEDHEQLLRDIEELRRLVAGCSTETILGRCFVYWIGRDSAADDQDLMSAARQWTFLLGLMLPTPEPADQHPFDTAEFERARGLLNKIFRAYALAYFPEASEKVTEEWRRTREVAMPAFLEYLGQGLLASAAQVEQRIRRYLTPFDDELTAELGLSASRAVEMGRWITDSMQSAADQLVQTATREERVRLDLLDRAKRERWDNERIWAEAQAPPYQDLALELLSRMRALGSVSLAHLKEQFGADSATAFWNLFAIRRGNGPELTYPTEANLAEERSLYIIEDERAMCPVANQVFLAILSRYERHLASGNRRESFFRKRDTALEQEVEASFRSLLEPGAKFLAGVFETADQQYEHDLIVRLDRLVLIIEAKASPPVEPFRDPDRAFVRIRDAFKSDRGIQRAFDQGVRLWRRWAGGDHVQLYDALGRLAYEFSRTDVDEVFLICATRDNFGVLAIDLSLLLEKGLRDPYPWCVNVLDLDAIVDAWKYFGWGASRFLDLLRQRIMLHGRVMCSDELEIVGFFIRHGGLHWLVEAKTDHIFLPPTYSDVFDKIYLARMGGAPVIYEPHKPHMSDLRVSLRQGKLVPVGSEEDGRYKKDRDGPCTC